MSALQETEKAIDDFVKKYCICANCQFFQRELFKNKCDGPDMQCEFEEGHDTGLCEQHEFADTELQRRLEELQDRWYMAWYIVEGFIYFTPPEAN